MVENGRSRTQSSADVSKLMKFLGMEMSVELQWTTKNLENYRNYQWSDPTIPHHDGPQIEIKPGWNVEYQNIWNILSILLLAKISRKYAFRKSDFRN